MPRKRVELDRDVKVNQILDHAVALLRAGGHEELTVNRVAQDLGLARAAVYWYFPSRDELFVAAAERLFAEAFASPPRRADHERQIVDAIDVLAEIHPVYAHLQSLAPTVPAAAALLDGFQRMLCDALKDLLAPHVPAERLQAVADTFVMFSEGLLGRRLPAAARRRHVRFALRALTS